MSRLKIKEFAEKDRRRCIKLRELEIERHNDDIKESKQPKIKMVPRNTLGVKSPMNEMADAGKQGGVKKTTGRAYGLPNELFTPRDQKKKDKDDFEECFKKLKTHMNLGKNLIDAKKELRETNMSMSDVFKLTKDRSSSKIRETMKSVEHDEAMNATHDCCGHKKYRS